MFQGNELTLLNCKTNFELYDSAALSQEGNSLLNYGETRAIVGVRKSLETAHPGRLTYVQNNQQIKQAYIADDGTIRKDTIMRVNNTNSNNIIEDAFVFDDVAAIKAKGFFFVFFQRPLTLNTYSDFLLPSTDPGNVVGEKDILAWDFRVRGSVLQCFAVKQSMIYRYEFTFDISKKYVTTKSAFVNFGKFDGVQYTVAVTAKEVIIACGDCSVPGVFFFDNDL